MPGYKVVPTPQRRLGGRLGVPKSTIMPTVIVKEEDRTPLKSWQRRNRVQIHIWQVFYDEAHGIALNAIESLIRDETVTGTAQTFQAPGGATTRKVIYKVPYIYGYRVGAASEPARLIADAIEDANGHVLPYVKFDGGRLLLEESAIAVLTKAPGMKGGS
jgi:hypothetical protein